VNIPVKPQTSHAPRVLAGKVALVTGSTSGIGLGIARALAAAGADVVLNGLGVAAEIDTTREQIATEFGVMASFSAADMTRPESIAGMIAATVAQSGRLDILVNNAGIQHVAPLDRFPVEKWDQILAINLSSAFHTTRLALPVMRENGFGRIVNIASAHGLVASPFKAAYVAAKHGIVGLTKVTALETAEEGITCNAICPGYVYTPLVEAQIDSQGQGARHFPRSGDPRRAAGAAAEQALCHRGRTRRTHGVPVDGSGGLDHRYRTAGRWRLDRALTWPGVTNRGHLRLFNQHKLTRGET
jgi:3-hydroxybutyrate dehydrogenase